MKKFKLSQNVILRREWFGCLVFNFVKDSYHQFNQDSLLILKEFQCATILPAVVDRLKKDFDVSIKDVEDFVKALGTQRMARPSSNEDINVVLKNN